MGSLRNIENTKKYLTKGLSKLIERHQERRRENEGMRGVKNEEEEGGIYSVGGEGGCCKKINKI